MNIKDKIELRVNVNAAVRSFFACRDYMEVETPAFVASPDMEPTLSHFESTMQDVRGKVYKGGFITSPEYALKKTVSSEVPKIFELARVFRNREPMDALHNPEFTMLEWYRMDTTLQEGIAETIALIQQVAQAVSGTLEARVQGRAISLETSSWQQQTVEELFRAHCGIDSIQKVTRNTYTDALDRLQMHWEETDTISDLFQRLMLNCVEPHLRASDEPIIVSHYPAHEATLAALDERGYTERFEIFVGGIELCNGYGELLDAREQRRRFEIEQQERARLGKTVFPVDEGLLEALNTLQGPLFGNALGLDRLMMLVAGLNSIEDVLLFPARQLFAAKPESL